MDQQSINEFQPDYAVPPSDILAAELQGREMTVDELAIKSGLAVMQINAILQSSLVITPLIAAKLECGLGMPKKYWLNLERRFQEAVTR